MPQQLAPKRLAIARLSHEGNSFSPLRTGQADFERREWVAGAAARAFYRGSRSELGAVVAFLEARPDWDGTFLRRAAFAPGFARLIDADTPGPAALNLSKLPFRHVPPAHLPGAW